MLLPGFEVEMYEVFPPRNVDVKYFRGTRN